MFGKKKSIIFSEKFISLKDLPSCFLECLNNMFYSTGLLNKTFFWQNFANWFPLKNKTFTFVMEIAVEATPNKCKFAVSWTSHEILYKLNILKALY